MHWKKCLWFSRQPVIFKINLKNLQARLENQNTYNFNCIGKFVFGFQDNMCSLRLLEKQMEKCRTKCQESDKMSRSDQNVRTWTNCQKSDKTPGVRQNIRSRTKCQKVDKMRKVEQNVRNWISGRSQTKCQEIKCQESDNISGVRQNVRRWTNVRSRTKFQEQDKTSVVKLN